MMASCVFQTIYSSFEVSKKDDFGYRSVGDPGARRSETIKRTDNSFARTLNGREFS